MRTTNKVTKVKLDAFGRQVRYDHSDDPGISQGHTVNNMSQSGGRGGGQSDQAMYVAGKISVIPYTKKGTVFTGLPITSDQDSHNETQSS